MSDNNDAPQPGDGCLLTAFKLFNPFSDWMPTPSNLQSWLTGDGSPVAGSSKEERSFHIGMAGLMIIVLSILIFIFFIRPSQSSNYNGLVSDTEGIPDVYFSITNPENNIDPGTEALKNGEYQLTDGLLKMNVSDTSVVITTGKQSLRFQIDGNDKLIYQYLTADNTNPPTTSTPNNEARIDVASIQITIRYVNQELKVWKR